MTVKGGNYKGILGQHLVGHQARSSHLGYDCYLTGASSGVDAQGNPTGKVRMVLRPNRLSPQITEATRTILPQEMWWPQRDHHGAHGCIDAVLTQDHASLALWKRQWPSHEFGYESFLIWCQRAQANGVAPPRTGMLDTIPSHVSGNMPRSEHAPALFPVGTELPEHRIKVRQLEMDGYTIKIFVVKFRNRTQAMRVDVLGHLAGGGDGDDVRHVILGRAYVDLLDSAMWQVIEHHPGNCRALGLPAGLIYSTIGVRTPPTAADRSIRLPERQPGPARAQTPRQRAVEVGMAAASLNQAAAETVGDRGPVQAGPARMDYLRRTNRRTRGGIMPAPHHEDAGMYGAHRPGPDPLKLAEPDVDLSVFPGPSPVQP